MTMNLLTITYAPLAYVCPVKGGCRQRQNYRTTPEKHQSLSSTLLTIHH